MNQHPTTWAWAQDLKGLSKLVLLGLADYFGTKSKAAFPSFETLADKCDISRTSVYNAIKDLKLAVLIRVTQRREDDRQLSNLYTLLTKKKAVKQVDLSSKLSSDLSSRSCTRPVWMTRNEYPEALTPSPSLSGG